MRQAPTALTDVPVVIKSAGEMASGLAVRLYRAGFTRLLMLETPAPLAVRRAVSFCEAVYDGEKRVEDITAVKARSPEDISAVWDSGRIAVAVDPEWSLIGRLRPEVTVDAIIAKRNLGTRIDEAPLVLALGPGFTAGKDVHYVIETMRGHNLGRVYAQGEAAPNTGIPGDIAGHTMRRVLRAPVDGVLKAYCEIGDVVQAGDAVCSVGDVLLQAPIGGVVRGLIRSGSVVGTRLKVGDIDPRGEREYCCSISEKARALGGAVLEVVCGWVAGARRA